MIGTRRCDGIVRRRSNADAQYHLGNAYAKGEGVAEDRGEAVRWYRAAAEQGKVEAQFYLGCAYNFGNGVTKDHGEAVRWFRAAAEQENAESPIWVLHTQMAEVLPRIMVRRCAGFGWRQSRRMRLRNSIWEMRTILATTVLPRIMVRRRAGIDGGRAGGCVCAFSLGNAYYKGVASNVYHLGEGIARDYHEAVYWYRLAAEQGNAGAQNNLGNAHYLGRGVSKNYYESYVWHFIARASGSDEAAGVISDANWRGHLSETEINSAQEEAERRTEAINNRP